MSRERIAELALLSYPAAAREARGEEMLATLYDVSAGSRLGFAREIVDLARLGLRMRAISTASVGARRLIADGLCLAAAWLMTLDVSTLVTQRARGMHDPLLAAGAARPAGGRARARAHRPRPAGRLRGPRVDRAAPAFPLGPPPGDRQPRPRVAADPLLLRHGRRPAATGDRPAAARLADRAGDTGLTLAPPNGERSPLLLAYVVLGAMLVTAFALAMLPTDPRPAIAGAVSLSTLGVSVVIHHHDAAAPAILFVAAAPLILAAAATRTRHLRRATPL
jgi:hypothetical protein